MTAAQVRRVHRPSPRGGGRHGPDLQPGGGRPDLPGVPRRAAPRQPARAICRWFTPSRRTRRSVSRHDGARGASTTASSSGLAPRPLAPGAAALPSGPDGRGPGVRPRVGGLRWIWSSISGSSCGGCTTSSCFTILGAAVGGAFAVLLPPIYRAEARLVVESEQIPGNLASSTVQVGGDRAARDHPAADPDPRDAGRDGQPARHLCDPRDATPGRACRRTRSWRTCAEASASSPPAGASARGARPRRPW